MRSLLFSLLFSGVCFAQTYVQSVGGVGFASATLTLSLTTTAGNSLALCTSTDTNGNVSVSSVSGGGSTWTKVASGYNSSNTASSEMWVSYGISGGAQNIIITWASSLAHNLGVMVETHAPAVTNTSNQSIVAATGAPVTTTAQSVVVGCTNNSANATPAAGFTQRQSQVWNVYLNIATEDNAAASTYTPYSGNLGVFTTLAQANATATGHSQGFIF